MPVTDGHFTKKMLPPIDLFCRVIDNLGDIGVCWRLARQLVAEHGAAVRLIVDDLGAFHVIAPDIVPHATSPQTLLGVEVVPWSMAETLTPAAVVIEAFACDPPAAYVRAMAARAAKPVWLNLEYLSAEAWVDDVHGRPSPHPRLPLTKHFFCPGFTEASGGVIRERSLAPPSPVRRSPSPLRLFAFTYPAAPVRALAAAFASAGQPLTVTTAAPLAERDAAWAHATPVAQTEFDGLLAHFDLLVVRGEDSFVRAQWAARPLLWHIYPTADGAHRIKLDAWLDRYVAGLPAVVARDYRALSHAFIRGDTTAAAYGALVAHLPALCEHASRWRHQLAQQSDLATRLLAFIASATAQKVS